MLALQAQPPPPATSPAAGGNGSGRVTMSSGGVSPSQPQAAHYQVRAHRLAWCCPSERTLARAEALERGEGHMWQKVNPQP